MAKLFSGFFFSNFVPFYSSLHVSLVPEQGVNTTTGSSDRKASPTCNIKYEEYSQIMQYKYSSEIVIVMYDIVNG